MLSMTDHWTAIAIFMLVALSFVLRAVWRDRVVPHVFFSHELAKAAEIQEIEKEVATHNSTDTLHLRGRAQRRLLAAQRELQALVDARQKYEWSMMSLIMASITSIRRLRNKSNSTAAATAEKKDSHCDWTLWHATPSLVSFAIRAAPVILTWCVWRDNSQVVRFPYSFLARVLCGGDRLGAVTEVFQSSGAQEEGVAHTNEWVFCSAMTWLVMCYVAVSYSCRVFVSNRR